MLQKPNIIRAVPCEGIPYQGHICHVLLGQTTGRLVVSVYTTDKDLQGGYIADFCETDPVRVQELVERLLRNLEGKARRCTVTVV